MGKVFRALLAWGGWLWLAGCALPGPGRPDAPGIPWAGPGQDLPLLPADPLRSLREEKAPWGALTLQKEAQVQKALGHRPFPWEPAAPRPPGGPEEAWLLHRGGNLIRPLGKALGVERWFRRQALSFDGRRLHTALQEWLARLGGTPPPGRESGTLPLAALDFRATALLRGRSPLELVLRPARNVKITWNDRRGGLRWSRPLAPRLHAEAGITVRNARIRRPSSCLGVRAELPGGWLFRARLGTHVGPATLDLPWDASRRTAPGLVLALGLRF